jgi:AcrR family transcriptional regulator
LSKTTRSEKKIEEIKKTILQEALELLQDEGFDNLSMYKLGKRTDMTAANLYNYYKNKDQLIIAIHKKTFELLYDMLINAVALEKDPVEKLKKVIKTFLDFGKKFPNFYDLMFNRRVPQVSDYQGTSEEVISRDEYQSSIRNLNLVVDIGKDIISLHPELEGIDAKVYFVKIFGELHGILSLYNSGILKEIIEKPDLLIDRLPDDLLALYLNKK